MLKLNIRNVVLSLLIRFTYFLNYCKVMDVKVETVQCGWSILLDCYMTGKRNTFTYQLLAVSAIYIAIQFVSDKSPFRNQWWTLFDVSYDFQINCKE